MKDEKGPTPRQRLADALHEASIRAVFPPFSNPVWVWDTEETPPYKATGDSYPVVDLTDTVKAALVDQSNVVPLSKLVEAEASVSVGSELNKFYNALRANRRYSGNADGMVFYSNQDPRRPVYKGLSLDILCVDHGPDVILVADAHDHCSINSVSDNSSGSFGGRPDMPARAVYSLLAADEWGILRYTNTTLNPFTRVQYQIPLAIEPDMMHSHLYKPFGPFFVMLDFRQET